MPYTANLYWLQWELHEPEVRIWPTVEEVVPANCFHWKVKTSLSTKQSGFPENDNRYRCNFKSNLRVSPGLSFFSLCLLRNNSFYQKLHVCARMCEHIVTTKVKWQPTWGFSLLLPGCVRLFFFYYCNYEIMGGSGMLTIICRIVTRKLYQ